MNFVDATIIFTSIILEAMPFVLIGVIISSIINEFVSDETFKKIIPKNPILGSFVGVLMGFFLPSCDCAVIPVARRLMKKGVPLNVCVSFMLAAPIVNPITIISTVYSFKSTMPLMIVYRLGLGILVAMIAGIITSLVVNKKEIFKKSKQGKGEDDICGCGVRHGNKQGHFYHIIEHSKEEFLEIMKFLMIGALITTLFQLVLVKLNISTITSNIILQILIMMAFAYSISLCSTADAFIAKNFIYSMSNNSILAFLIFGAMIDIKNTIVLSQNFSKKFIISLISIVFICIFILTMLVKI